MDYKPWCHALQTIVNIHVVLLGCFHFYFSLISFLYFGGIFNNRIIPLTLVGFFLGGGGGLLYLHLYFLTTYILTLNFRYIQHLRLTVLLIIILHNLLLVGCEMIIVNLELHASSAIYYLTSNACSWYNTFVKYTMTLCSLLDRQIFSCPLGKILLLLLRYVNMLNHQRNCIYFCFYTLLPWIFVTKICTVLVWHYCYICRSSYKYHKQG